ncbi:hypothetical protein ABK040_004888 [Willaertia magna]
MIDNEVVESTHSQEEIPINLVNVNILTFGKEYGRPENSTYNFIYDLREFPNPLTTQKRKTMTGLHKELRSDFFSNESVQTFFKECFTQIGKEIIKIFKSDVETKEINILVFCHKGKHRSVAFAEELAREIKKHNQLKAFINPNVQVIHRDISKKGSNVNEASKKGRKHKGGGINYFNSE